MEAPVDDFSIVASMLPSSHRILPTNNIQILFANSQQSEPYLK